MNLGRELYLQEGKSEVFSFDANMASVQKLKLPAARRHIHNHIEVRSKPVCAKVNTAQNDPPQLANFMLHYKDFRGMPLFYTAGQRQL